MKASKLLRSLACLVICFAMLLQPMSILATGASSDELIINGTFADTDSDGKADDWSYWNGTVASASAACDENGLTITADSTSETQRLTVHQTVSNLNAGGTYHLTGRYQVSSTSYGSLEIRYNAGGSNVTIANHTSVTDGWITIDEEIVTTRNSIKLEIVVSLGATLTCSIDDISLTEVVVEEPEPEEPEEEEPTAENLIQNPTYETSGISSVPNWNYYPAYDANVGTNYNASISDGIFTGTVLGGSNLILHQTMALTEDQLNKTYTFTGDIKTENLSSYAMFKVYLQDASGKQLSSFLSNQVKGTTDWATLTLEFEVPESIGGVAVASIKLEQYILKGTGAASFRNPVIVKTGDFVTPPEGDPIDTLVKNGGYETTLSGFPASWNLWTSTGGLNAVSDREVFYDGYSSLHLSNVTEGTDSRGSVHQTFTITEDLQELWGQSVKVSQWVKTENFVGDALAIRVHYATVSGSYISKAMPVASTQDWTYYEYIIDLPSTFQTIKVETLYDYAQGDVWIDNTEVHGYIKATGIDVSPEPVILAVGDSKQLELTYSPANTTIKEVTIANSNGDVVTVNETGLVTALANGTSTITITHVDGTKKQVAVLVTDETIGYNQDISVTTKQNIRTTGSLPDGYSYEVVAAAQHGTFLMEDEQNYIYYPDKDYVGSDSVTLLVTGADGGQTLVIANLTVEQVNAAPVFDTVTILTKENTAITGTINAVDPENDTLTYAVAAQPEHGTLALEGTAYTYTPVTGYNGYDTVTFTVTDSQNNTASEIATIYIAADVSEILATVKTEHSRLLADDARFEEIANLIQTDENMKAWFDELKETIDPLLEDNTPVPYSCPDGVRLDTQGSKDVVNLAFMFRITNDQAYFNRAWLELESLCNPETYPDWHPSHLLDTAMTANGVAIAYDWLYDYLTNNQKELVESAMYTNGLEEAQTQFNANHMFVTNLNNWNYVCNGGFITTALALAHHENEAYSQLAGEIMQRCYQSIQYGLPQYAPEGDSIEGISYWDYGTRYFVSLMASISSATTVENPFLSAPGLDLTALYPIYMSGKAGTYNYSDNDMTDAVGYLNLWLAEVYEEPSWTWYHKYYMAQDAYDATIYDLLYYNAEYYESEAPEQLDAYYTSQAVTTMRSDFTDDLGSFLGFKGGLNGAAHGDIDIGSFVYDLYGYRWALDFGKEDYNLTGYWEIADGGTRWNYYRKNALGHNTLVINPENGANQTVGAYAGATEQNINNPGGGYTILDMTDAYQKNAVDVKRGFAYFDRLQVLIRDEYTLKETGDVYWQMHTEADVTISDDGKIATLTQGDKTLLLKLFDENGTDLKFQTMAATPYEGLATYEGENPNEGVTKIYILAKDVQTGTFNVLLTPADLEDPEIKSLDQWRSYDFSGVCEHDWSVSFAWSENLTTCTATFTCNECNNSFNHQCDVTAKSTTANCTVAGQTAYTAVVSFNSKDYTDTRTVTIPATEHTVVTDKAVDATCTETGKTEGKHCSVCQTVLVKQETIPAKGHNWSNWTITVPATGTSDGKEIRSCSVCGLEEKRSIDKLVYLFVDLEPGEYYEIPVAWAVEHSITNGLDDTHFAPNVTCTRAQVVTFLWRASGSPSYTSSYNPFTDVTADEYYYDAVLWAAEQGITNGTSTTTFSPSQNCTRAQAVTFLWRALGEPAASNANNPFTDLDARAYYYDAVLWAVKTNVTNGVGGGKFTPNATCTRGQIVTFLYRALA